MNSEEFQAAVLELRGVEPNDVCPDCHGIGIKSYGDTATWRGGAGGQTITSAVCNRCWGSGSKSRAWPSHREIEHLRNHKRRARELLARHADALVKAQGYLTSDWFPHKSRDGIAKQDVLKAIKDALEDSQ